MRDARKTGAAADDDAIRAGEYALGLLDVEAARAFEARLRQEPELRALHAGWAGDLVALADGLEEEDVPARAWDALRARTFGSRRARRRLALGRLGLLPLALGSVAAALVVYLVVNLGLLLPVGDAAPEFEGRIASPDGALALVAAWDAQSGALTLVRLQGAPPPEGAERRAWLLDGDGPPLPLGALSDEGTLLVTLPAALGARLGETTITLTDDPADIPLDAAPAGPVVARGTLRLAPDD